MDRQHKWIFPIVFCLFILHHSSAQFIDNFDGQTTPIENGWRYNTGDGSATMNLIQGDGHVTLVVDATNDKRNIWWALVAHQVQDLNMKNLVKPDFELRAEARIKVSHAPRRVNLHFNHSRTTDYHSHLMEYDIPDTVNWHTISFTTHDFDVQPGDQVNAQMALMDWGQSIYRIDIDYFKVDVVNRNKIGKDLGTQIPYHPPVVDPDIYSYHIPVSQDAIVDLMYPDMNFNNWQILEDDVNIPILSVSTSQVVLLKWDFSEHKGKKVTKSGLLELTTHSLQRSPEYKKDFGMIRVVEILAGDAQWDQESVTWDSFCEDQSLEKVLNTQMVIDYEVNGVKGGKSFFTITYPVLQRLIDGKTLGLAIRPLGAVNASFYASEFQKGNLSPKLHFDIE
ncbi:hypothetical protein ACFLU5_04385 [Bacteroidota bacterium]